MDKKKYDKTCKLLVIHLHTHYLWVQYIREYLNQFNVTGAHVIFTCVKSILEIEYTDNWGSGN